MKMNEEDFNLGKNAEVESITHDGRYVIKYIKTNGEIGAFVWSEDGKESSEPVDPNAIQAIIKLRQQLGIS